MGFGLSAAASMNPSVLNWPPRPARAMYVRGGRGGCRFGGCGRTASSMFCKEISSSSGSAAAIECCNRRWQRRHRLPCQSTRDGSCHLRRRSIFKGTPSTKIFLQISVTIGMSTDEMVLPQWDALEFHVASH